MATRSAKKSLTVCPNPGFKKCGSHEAMEKVITKFNRRSLYYEKAFVFTADDNMGHEDYIWTVVANHKWRKFAGPPHSVSEGLVKEFYSSVLATTNEKVIIRGKEIDFSPSAINAFYGLTGVPDGIFDYTETPNEKDMESIVNTLCIHGTEWELSTKEGAQTLKDNTLKPGPKIWIDVLRTKLMPCTYRGTFTKARAILLYCIITGRAINVGKIIHREIKTCAKKAKGSLWFPSLITGLCVQAGVPLEEDELMEAPLQLADETMSPIVNKQDDARHEEDSEEEEEDASSGFLSRKRKSMEKTATELTPIEATLEDVDKITKLERRLYNVLEDKDNNDEDRVMELVETCAEKEEELVEEEKSTNSDVVALPSTEKIEGKEKVADPDTPKEVMQDPMGSTTSDFNKVVEMLRTVTQKLSAVEEENQEIKKELQTLREELKRKWTYDEKKDHALMKHYRSNYNKVTTFPAFPVEILPDEDEV